MKFSVWAPAAKRVELAVGDSRIQMQGEADGYFSLEFDLPEGLGYRFAIDGGPPHPDPRSRWQPNGVHGESHPAQLPAPATDTFHPVSLREAIIYELHVGTFTPEGTYQSAQSKLGYLKDLGVTHIELLPLAAFPGRRGWGYDGVALYAPQAAYGTPAELFEFVAACHGHGIAVLLDVVYNHLGPDGNYLGQFAPYFTDHYKTGWGAAVNYDGPLSDDVRRFVIDNALMWLRDYRFDGLRLDAVHAIFCFEALHVLEQLAAAVRELGAEQQRKLVLIAESDLNDPKLVRPVNKGGYGLDAHWEDDFHHALHACFTGERSGYYEDFSAHDTLVRALRDGYVYQGQYSKHRKRRHGRKPIGVGADQLVVCAQNHDQIGNRAQGERLSMMLDSRQLKAIATLTLLSGFVPMLFQGEEWGATTPFLYFTDHENADLGRAVAEGRAREFAAFKWQGEVPNPQEESTFQRSKLNWSEIGEANHADLLDWHRRLIALRRENLQAVPPRSRPRVGFEKKKRLLSHAHGLLLAILNLSDGSQRFTLPGGNWELVMASDPPVDSSLAAGGTLVYRTRRN
ncbi:MAG TPA: malto-oligosyltrehalose trehalohydrolase [Steroidobacteraceae bacterium]|jgi:maltooligosyltrehalose trehalohydrolase